MPARTEAGVAYIRFKGDFSEVNRQLNELGKGYDGINKASERSAKQTQKDERVRQKSLADSLKHQNLLAASFGRSAREQKTLTERYRDQIKALGASNASYKEAAQHMGVTTREAKALADANRRLSVTTQDVDRHTVSFGRNLDRNNRHLFSANAKISLLQRTIGLVKFPALITGVGLAAQALGSLGAGAVGLVGALAPLSGLVAAAPALYGALGQAAGVVALSGIKDLTQAMAGNQQALKRLTPAARKFMGQLKEMKPQFDSLKRAVQRPLFAGLNRGLHSAVRNFSVLKDVLGGTAQVLGHFAEQAGKLLGSKGFGRDFRRIGQGNNRLLRNFGKAALLVVKALTNVLVVAQPLVRFIGKLAVRFGEWANSASEAGRKSGRMNTFFHQTIQITKQLIRIMVNLGTGLINMGKAGADLGHTLIDSFEAATEKFKEFTGSAEGQNKMRAYFESAKGPLLEFFRLIRDLGGALIQLSGPQAGLTPLLKQIRTELLPSLTAVIQTTTQAFGPAFVSLLTHLANLFGLFKGSSQPLVLWAKAMDGLVQSINFLLENIPGLKFLLSWFIGVAAVAKTLQFVGMISGAKVLMPILARLLTRLKLINKAGLATAFAPGFVAGGVGAGARGRAGHAPNVFAPGHGGSGGHESPFKELGKHATGAGLFGSALAAADPIKTPGFTKAITSRFPVLGRLAANSFVKSFAGAIPEFAVTFALFDAIGDLASGQFKEFGIEAGTALVGGIVGFLAGGPAGAAVGASLGEMFGPALISNFGTAIKDALVGTAVLGPIGAAASVTAGAFGVHFGDELKKVPIIGGLFGGGGGDDHVEQAVKPVRRLVDIVNSIVTTGKGPLEQYGKGVGSLALKITKAFAQTTKGVRDPLFKLAPTVGNVFTQIAHMFQGKMGDLGLITKRGMANIVQAMQRGPEQGRAAMIKVFGKAVDGVRSQMTRMGFITEQGVAKINRIFALEAKLLGLKPGPGVTRAGSPTGGPRGSGGPEHGRPGGAQHGAAIVPGIGSGDTHMLHLDGVPIARVESGEQISVLNRTATAALMGMNTRIPRRASGGYVAATGNRLRNLRWAGLAPNDYTDDVSAGALNIETGAALMALQALKKRVGNRTTRALFNEAMRMDHLHRPYLWGGGHAGFSRNGPWDCSGAVSQVIHGAGFPLASPMVSGGFTTYGLPGLSGDGQTGIWANSGHVWMTINGQGFSTSAENPGNGWGTVSYTSRPGFVKRHPDLAAAMSHMGPNSRKGQPLQKGAMHGGVIRGFRGGGVVGLRQGGQFGDYQGAPAYADGRPLRRGPAWLRQHAPELLRNLKRMGYRWRPKRKLWLLPPAIADPHGPHSPQSPQPTRRGGLLGFKQGGSLQSFNKVYPRGGGPAIPFNAAAAIAEKFGLPGVTMAQVAIGESTLHPGAVSPDGGYGLWQMTPSVQDASTVRRWNRIGSYFNPFNNARMAKLLPVNGNTYHGSSHVKGWNLHYKGTFGGGGKATKVKGVKAVPFNVDDLPLSKGAKNTLTRALRNQDKLTNLANVYADYAARAADLGELVAGKDELEWLYAQVDQMLKLRTKLVTAYQLLVKAIERLNEQIAKMKNGEGKRKVKGIRNAANTQLGTINSALADLQGNVVNIDPYSIVNNIKDVPDTTFGGAIGEVVSSIKNAGGDLAETKGLSAEDLKNIKTLRDLGVQFLPQQFAGLFATGGLIRRGQWGIVGEAGPEAISGPAQVTPMTTPNLQVKVFVGDREITDIVRTEIGEVDRASSNRYRMGVPR